ncbi:hypothetical protein BLNAU_22708 [Blattamonas nauphoetae]|uniref:Uncharacterized protein n=1 Tax=Blattamonas nauphoetae TaxID=2049346 RepID=A0ABQ9WS89_9EUKA|nr:hypothetical protein BLNAU_22708 [Blattamonas nauphoetae]
MGSTKFPNYQNCPTTVFGQLPQSYEDNAVVFQSLVATVKLQPELDVSLEAKVVKFLEYVDPDDDDSADAFLRKLASSSGNSPTDFVQSIVVLIPSANQVITTAAMKMLGTLIMWCSLYIRLALVKADLLPQIVISLNPQSLSFAEAEDIHINLMKSISWTIYLSTPNGLRFLGIEDENEQQAVHETVLKQVLAPSERYIRHLCVNRFSIFDEKLSSYYLALLAQILEMCPYYRATMDFVVHMPVFLTITSCLTFYKNDESIWYFLYLIHSFLREWNEQGGEDQQMRTDANRMLRMEGIEDVIEQKLQNNRTRTYARWTVDKSIALNNLLGMNLR